MLNNVSNFVYMIARQLYIKIKTLPVLNIFWEIGNCYRNLEIISVYANVVLNNIS